MTASAVELTVTEGNRDMFKTAGASASAVRGHLGSLSGSKTADKGDKATKSMIAPIKHTVVKPMWGFSGEQGVCLDPATDPPSLYGQVEYPVNGSESLLELFGAIASRNTAATGMNGTVLDRSIFKFI